MSDVTGEMKTEQVKEGNLSKNDLDPNDAFLVSAGALGIWVWLGKSATKAERQGVMQMGAKFIKDNNQRIDTALDTSPTRARVRYFSGDGRSGYGVDVYVR